MLTSYMSLHQIPLHSKDERCGAFSLPSILTVYFWEKCLMRQLPILTLLHVCPFSIYPYFFSVKTNFSPIYYRVLTLAQMRCFPTSFPLVMLLFWAYINILLNCVLVSRLMVSFSGWKIHCKFSLLDMWIHFPAPSEFWNKKNPSHQWKKPNPKL